MGRGSVRIRCSYITGTVDGSVAPWAYLRHQTLQTSNCAVPCLSHGTIKGASFIWKRDYSILLKIIYGTSNPGKALLKKKKKTN